MSGILKKILGLNHTQNMADLDDPNTTLIHREIILSKPILKKIYVFWYQQIMKDIPQNAKVLEIGSGGGFLKDVYPNVSTSDILPLPNCDLVVDATQLPFDDNSLDAIVMVNVFHHIPDSEKFLKEAQRVLKPNGRIAMVEPAHSWFSKFIYQNFHHEPFDPERKEWKFDSTGPMSSSNQALPYIVFDRDKAVFEQKFANLNIHKTIYHTPFTYLLSGGVSMKSMIPSWSYGFLKGIENVVSSRYFNMFWTVIIKKENV